MAKENLKIGILYLSFHNSLKKLYGVNRIVSKEAMIIKLGRQFLVPKRLRVSAVKELEKMGLLKEESKTEYKILDYKLNIEEDASKFLRAMSIFNIFR